MRLRARLSVLSLLLAVVACAPHAPAAAPAPDSAPPAAAPVAPEHATAPDTTCRVADDCEVKNVGNCCGYFPACVNRDATVDPDAVRAECERSGMASVCGWKEIQACDCVQGQCRAVDGPIRVDR
ncbi:hypothetical protein [Luteimonas kalidii]|uniref:Secreted protein n=1 Tax=Luteimonas kalidii TaxID=3042025 RepID=A0ABT6JRQ1_9GAMM|nr:hypothetical protein [Luteimonas kalidii]MDH5833142.1 hypothetical protein [Luteimonas kalidii]